MKLPDFGQNRRFASLRKRMETKPPRKQAAPTSSKTDKRFLRAVINEVKKIGERRRHIREAEKTLQEWGGELERNKRRAVAAEGAAESALLQNQEEKARERIRQKVVAMEACDRIEKDIRSIEAMIQLLKKSNEEDMYEIERLKRQHEMWILKHEAAQTQNKYSGIARQMDIKAEKKELERELNRASANESAPQERIERVEREMERLRQRLQPSGKGNV